VINFGFDTHHVQHPSFLLPFISSFIQTTSAGRVCSANVSQSTLFWLLLQKCTQRSEDRWPKLSDSSYFTSYMYNLHTRLRMKTIDKEIISVQEAC
jgi:hypothetical protein